MSKWTLREVIQILMENDAQVYEIENYSHKHLHGFESKFRTVR